ncbi:MAG: PAS domain S-box protein [Syntrophobacterales bacterium]|nr:PAS domain S-box protein [Syntrophobacterales bacterium]
MSIMENPSSAPVRSPGTPPEGKVKATSFLRRFPFLFSRHALGIILTLNLLLLTLGLYLGMKSLGQMREIVKEDFNLQQLSLARQSARLLEQDFDFLKRELTTLNLSPSIQYLERLTWANRMRATLASVRSEGVVEIRRVNREGTRAFLVDDRSLDYEIRGDFTKEPWFLWAKQVENKGRIYVGRVSTTVPRYVGRLIMVVAIPTYEESVDEFHPHPSGAFSGVTAFYVDAHHLAEKFTRGITSGKTGYAWIMDDQGLFLSHPEREFIGKNAFTVRKERMPAISFDAINEIQREKMLTGQEGWGVYISGWHGGMAGEIRKLIAYTPVRLSEPPFGTQNERAPSWSVAVVAPVSEVEGVVHTLYRRQFLLQVIIGFFVLSGTILLLNFRYEAQFSASLEEEVNRQREELRKSEARYQALVENAADLIYTVDAEGHILSINNFAARLFSRALESVPDRDPASVPRTPEDFIGRSLYEIFSPKSADFHLEWLREIRETGRVRSKRHQVTIGDREFWFSTSIVGLKDDADQIYSYEIISRDITGRKTFEDRLINMEKLASIGTLAAGVAHEINNPIAVILGFTEHLIEQAEPYPEIQETLKIIEEEGLKCKKIVENLLTFARAPEKSESSADLNAVLGKMLAVVRNSLLTKKIRLEADIAPSLPRVAGDPRELQQVFINLINNAIDAMRGGGVLTVKAHPTPDGRRVAIEFHDTGNGIPREVQNKIFDPFFTTKKTGEGTGLGLSTSYGIVSKYGGNIVFTSFPASEYPDKHGTTFTVYLPVVGEAVAAPPEAEVKEQPLGFLAGGYGL